MRISSLIKLLEALQKDEGDKLICISTSLERNDEIGGVFVVSINTPEGPDTLFCMAPRELAAEICKATNVGTKEPPIAGKPKRRLEVIN